MTIAQLATIQDVAARLGRETEPDELQRVNSLLDEASVQVRSYLQCDRLPDPLPESVVMVVSRMVARAMAAQDSPQPLPIGHDNLAATMGPFAFNQTFSPGATDGGVWMTRQDREMLRPVSCRGRVGNVPTW